MRIAILGRGHRVIDILDALRATKGDISVVSADEATLKQASARSVRHLAADPAAVRLAEGGISLGSDDLIIVAEFEEAPLRAILTNLRSQKPAAPQLVFTPLQGRQLARDFPRVQIRSDRTLYQSELRTLLRRASSRQKVDAIRQIVRSAGRAIIIIWGNPDPDAIASAFALRELLQPDGPDLTIAYMGEYTRPENLALVNVLRIPTVKFAPELLKPGTATITVDAQPSFFGPDSALRFDIIIDHHPAAPLGPHRFADVRPRYGSTCTILTEYFRDSGVPMPRRVATALFYGLKVDTADLTRNVSDADMIAFRFLHARADENIVRTIQLTQLPLSTLDFFQIALARKRIAQDTAFSYLGLVENADVGVPVADFFIQLSGISWAVIGCRVADKIVVVFRSDGFRKHAGHIAESIFGDYGTAGGHRTMARAELPLSGLQSEIPDPSDEAIEGWLIGRLSTRLKALARREVKSHTPEPAGVPDPPSND